MIYAFTLDASACSGCKACQEACKDKNGLAAGLLWRRVVEVSGGEWRSSGHAWENSVFAYNLSIACNHCTHPKCAGVCPTDAYTVRPDGVVMLDPSRCMGCGYCAWACPYGAPQYDARHGIMTKCDFCIDYLDAGLPPSCVAACPLRALNFGTVEELVCTQEGKFLWQLPASEHPFPLPNYSRTEPHLVIKPHAGMNASLAKEVANLEELQPPGARETVDQPAGIHELPLVGFTLLSQMAAGMAVCSLLLFPIPLPVLLAIGILLAIGGLISFLHLGRKRNAWRSIMHLKKSWLSREILAGGALGASWVAAAGAQWVWKTSPSPWPMAVLGVGLIYCMARVYSLRAVPAWNSWRTLAAFLVSTANLGSLSVNLAVPHQGWLIAGGTAMLVEMGLMLTARPATNGINKLRIALLSLGILGTLLTAITVQADQVWLAGTIFLIALAAEVIGRWQFYAARVPFPASDNRKSNS